MKLIDIIQKITESINIDQQHLTDILKGVNLNEEIPDEINTKILELISIDVKIRQISETINDATTNNKFDELKKNLARLQILVLLKKISKTEIKHDTLQSLIDLFTDKIQIVNDVLLSQIGGSEIDYKYNYYKYKGMYITLKFLLGKNKLKDQLLK